MNQERLKNYINNLQVHYDMILEEVSRKTGKEVFDEIYKYFTIDKIYDHLLTNAKYYNVKYLLEEDVLNRYYEKFIHTEYEHCKDDLDLFFKDQMEIERKKYNQNEM